MLLISVCFQRFLVFSHLYSNQNEQSYHRRTYSRTFILAHRLFILQFLFTLFLILSVFYFPMLSISITFQYCLAFFENNHNKWVVFSSIYFKYVPFILIYSVTFSLYRDGIIDLLQFLLFQSLFRLYSSIFLCMCTCVCSLPSGWYSVFPMFAEDCGYLIEFYVIDRMFSNYIYCMFAKTFSFSICNFLVPIILSALYIFRKKWFLTMTCFFILFHFCYLAHSRHYKKNYILSLPTLILSSANQSAPEYSPTMRYL